MRCYVTLAGFNFQTEKRKKLKNCKHGQRRCLTHRDRCMLHEIDSQPEQTILLCKYDYDGFFSPICQIPNKANAIFGNDFASM